MKELVIQHLEKYFNHLSKFGYLEYPKVNRLLVLIFILELLDMLENYLSEDDYREIFKAINFVKDPTINISDLKIASYYISIQLGYNYIEIL